MGIEWCNVFWSQFNYKIVIIITLILLSQMISDIYFTYPSMWEARKKAQLDWPVYFYLLTSWQRETTTSDLPIRG